MGDFARYRLYAYTAMFALSIPLIFLIVRHILVLALIPVCFAMVSWFLVQWELRSMPGELGGKVNRFIAAYMIVCAMLFFTWWWYRTGSPGDLVMAAVLGVSLLIEFFRRGQRNGRKS